MEGHHGLEKQDLPWVCFQKRQGWFRKAYLSWSQKVTEFHVFASSMKTLSFKVLVGLTWRHGVVLKNEDKNTRLSGSSRDETKQQYR